MTPTLLLLLPLHHGELRAWLLHPVMHTPLALAHLALLLVEEVAAFRSLLLDLELQLV